MRKFLPEVIVLCAILMVVSYGFAQTWTKSTSLPGNTDWTGIACSADGKVILAVGSAAKPMVSTNSGRTWTNVATAPFIYFYGASSADGGMLVAPGSASGFGSAQYIYVSADLGNTWTQTSVSNANWHPVASSATGTKLFGAVSGGSIWLSTNSGTTWQVSSAPNKLWSSLSSSADGTKLIGSGSGQIYISTNSGNDWFLTSIVGSSVATSADGRTLVATGSSGTYISTDSGSSWRTNAINVPFPFGNNVASSADGKRLVLAGSRSPIYTSTNSGITWMTNNAPSLWGAVGSSADGCRLAAISHVNGIWVGQIAPSPQLNLGATNGSLTFSWTVPSTNFVLQQNLDLTTTNWVTLTNKPSLNYTNLNNELTLPTSNSSGFYRLKAQ